ncbi:MAG TPA: aromatic ring-hydroxylating dioxygenase subunit alpha, partial [Puia sp.]
MQKLNARFQINPDISLAKTLDTDFYTDPAVYTDSREKIFSKSWQFIGDKNLVSKPGICYPFTLLENYLDEPLLLIKDADGQVRCLSNVCTHRGTVLIGQACQVTHLRCRYHGRQFRLDGSFLSMPEFREVKNFPTKEDDLKRLPLHEWGPLLFGSLDLNADPKRYFNAMQERLSWLPIDDFIFKPALSAEYTVKSHWALYCENYLEGFHIPFVHAGLNAVIDFGNYTTEIFDFSNLQLGLAKTDEEIFDLPGSSPDFGKKVAAYYFYVFPNMMFNFYPWGLSINIVQPLSIDQNKVSFLTYVWKEELFNKGAGSGLDIVEKEDEEVVEAVQKGVRSR